MRALPRFFRRTQVDVYLDLMQYVYPKRKAVEFSGQDIASQTQVTVTLPSNGREALADLSEGELKARAIEMERKLRLLDDSFEESNGRTRR